MSSLLRGNSIDIVRVQDNKCEVDSNAIKSVLGKLIPSIPVCTLSICGPFREGKSFFLNLVVLYLQYLSDYSGYKTPVGEIPQWLNGDGCISNGFQFRSGIKGVTNGISMWSEVFLINRNGKQVYVVLLDSQGLYDNGKGKDMDKCIYGMTTFLSSFQILNFKSMNTLLFDSLSGLSSFVKEYRKTNSTKPFQHFSFLYRDYNSFSKECSFEKNVEEARNSVNDYFANTTDSDIKEKEAQLLNMFKTVSSFALPYPGDGVASKSSCGKISEISDRFRKMIGYYIESVIGNIEPLQLKEDKVKAKDFSSYMIETCNTFSDPTQFPDTSMMLNMQEFLRYQKTIEKIYGTAKGKLWMKFYHGNNRYVEPEKLENCFNQYKEEAKKEIDEKYPVKNDLIQKFINNAFINYKEYYCMIITTNEAIKPYKRVVGGRRYVLFGPCEKEWYYPELKSIPPNPMPSNDKDIQ